jgi:hypothetical protein
VTALVGALTQANLASTVDSLHDVTIFAPSNAAFQAIGSAVGSLSTAQLASILEYHVINGTVGYSSLLTNETIKTVQGGSVTITIEDGSVFVNSAKVIVPNVLVANGVVHVIDKYVPLPPYPSTPHSPYPLSRPRSKTKLTTLFPHSVLNPNNTAATPNPSTTTAAFSGASSGSSVPFTSGVSAATTLPPSATASKAASSSSSSGGAMGMRALPTGMVEMGALFGGAAIVLGGL